MNQVYQVILWNLLRSRPVVNLHTVVKILFFLQIDIIFLSIYIEYIQSFVLLALYPLDCKLSFYLLIIFVSIDEYNIQNFY